MLFESVKSHLRDQIARSLSSLTLLQTSDFQCDLHVFAQRAPGKKIVFLRYVTDLCRYAVDGIAAKKNTTRAGTEQPYDEIQQRRFAAPGGADDRNELPLVYSEIDGLQSQNILATNVILFTHAFDREKRRHRL
jgi:hypothetical protein